MQVTNKQSKFKESAMKIVLQLHLLSEPKESQMMSWMCMCQIQVKERFQNKVLSWDSLGDHNAETPLFWIGSCLIYLFDELFLWQFFSGLFLL